MPDNVVQQFKKCEQGVFITLGVSTTGEFEGRYKLYDYTESPWCIYNTNRGGTLEVLSPEGWIESVTLSIL